MEVLLGSFILVVALAALLGAFLGQSLLSANARNLTVAANDASRVMEQIRQQNSGDSCTTTPAVQPPAGTGTSWDAWLESASGGGKSFAPNPTLNELVAVTCQNENGTGYCGPSQVGSGEWIRAPSDPNPLYDPLRVTVTVCWRDRQRVVGECVWNGDLVAQNGAPGAVNADNRVIESPAMLTTLVTCRG